MAGSSVGGDGGCGGAVCGVARCGGGGGLGAAAQATAVAAAFEAARAATVDPSLVAANRSAVVRLVVSNLFGQNAPAIAAVEGQYEQMWAADVAAMARDRKSVV